MKSVVLCFDHVRHYPEPGGETNATKSFALFEQSDAQIAWYHSGSVARRTHPRDGARTAIGGAYEVLRRCWEPGDPIFVLGAGRGGYCAAALTHLIGTVGILPQCWNDLVDYVLTAYAMPRTRRTKREWQVVREVIGGLGNDNGDGGRVTVAYLGLWDALRDVVLPRPPAEALNVAAGRHAMAAYGGLPRDRLIPVSGEGVEQAWFRGGHRDVAGGPGSCAPLAGIAMGWVLDGAASAGVRMRTGVTPAVPDESDALAGSARGLVMRTVTGDALVHASVETYVQAHPAYRRRLPPRIAWTDRDWLTRGERLVACESATSTSANLVAAAS